MSRRKVVPASDIVVASENYRDWEIVIPAVVRRRVIDVFEDFFRQIDQEDIVARQLEAVVFALAIQYSYPRSQYESRNTQLMYAMATNAKGILRLVGYGTTECNLLQLATLDPKLLSTGTELDQKRQRHFQVREEGRNLIREIADAAKRDLAKESGIAAESQPWANRCGRCKKTGHVEWRLQQTRSADEPMTALFECKNCGHHWRG